MKAHELGDDETGSRGQEKVIRHYPDERWFHWLLATAILTLLVTGFSATLGWKFNWVPIHWITGVFVTLIVLYHIAKAIFGRYVSVMWPDRKDLANAWRSVRLVMGLGTKVPGKPGKYPLMQKLYHWGIAGWILVLIATGLLMLAKLDTPFWKRNPYFLTEMQWGIVYSIHGFLALGLITLIIIHVYFALRPDKIFLLRSMIVGWTTRSEWLGESDPTRWHPAPWHGEDVDKPPPPPPT